VRRYLKPHQNKQTMTTESPATQRDFVELQTDVSHSPLWNRDLAPTTIKERTWSTWNIAALWIGMSVVITTYTLAGGFIEAGMNWWQAMITILLGNTIVLIPMILNAHAGTKYGVSFPVLSRASFGTKGANIPAMLRRNRCSAWCNVPCVEHVPRYNHPRCSITHVVCFLSVLGDSSFHYSQRSRGDQTSRNMVGAIATPGWISLTHLGSMADRRTGPCANSVIRIAKAKR
jgi:hypothetical protein